VKEEQPPYGLQYGPPPGGHPLGQLLTVFRRRQRVILSVMALMTVTTTLIGLLKGEAYTATTLVVIEPDESRFAGFEEATKGASADAATAEIEIKYILSQENLVRAVERLGLQQDPSSIFPEDGSGSLTALLPSSWLIGGGYAETLQHDEDEGLADARQQAVAALRSGLEVSLSDVSNILAISFTTTDPVRAAELADGVSRAYVEGQLDRKLEDIEYASGWLASRVEELRLRVMEAERAIDEYRRANDLVEGSTFDSQQIATLMTQLIDARAERTAKQAKLQQVRHLLDNSDYDELDDALSSPLLARLHDEDLNLIRREAELSQEYGENHPRIQQLRAEQEKVARRIERELDGAVRGLENEVEVAQAREEAFRKSLEDSKGEAKGRSALTSTAEVQLRELEREASADRTLYESFLVRLKQLEEQQHISQADVRVLLPAPVPGAPSSPGPLIFAFLGFTGSLVLGSMLGFLLEQQDASLRSTRELEALFGAQAVGMVPSVEDKSPRLHDHMVSKPGSAYAEAVRTLFTRVRWADPDSPPKLLLVTSALPGEGKTSLAGSLALCAAQLQQSVLLIDLDLRRPAVGAFFGLQSDAGIVELAGDASFEEVVQRNDGVDILAAREHENPTAFITSRFIRSLLKEARQRYDWIIIDTPPVLGVADTKMLAPSVDAVLFVIRWERTKRDAARSALKELEGVSAKVIGAVLNNVDMRRHSYYAYGDSGQYHHKYSKYYKN
jgi:succinoglycan biosynthesis transport protein ExoP